MRDWLALPIRAPRVTLALVAAISLLLLPAALQVRVDSAVDRLLPVDDPERLHLDEVRATFGSDELIVIALFADDVYAPATLARIAAIVDDLARLDVVDEVTALTNVSEIRVTEDGLGRVPLLPPPPWTDEAIAALHRDAPAHPIAGAVLVGSDGRAAGILVRLIALTDEELVARRVDDRIRQVLAAHPGPEAVAVTGLPTLKVHAAAAMIDDVRRFLPIGVLVIVAVLLVTFRTVRGVALPLATVLVGLEWTAAFMTLRGGAYTLGTLVLSPLLLSVGIAYAVHVVSRYEHERARGDVGAAPTARTFARVGLPIAMAGLTTLAGFAAFLGNPIPSIRDFGWYAGVGLIAILGATFTVLPAALTVLPRTAAAARPPSTHGWAARLVAACTDLAVRRRRAVLLAAGGILLVSAAGIGRIEIETDYLRFFGRSHPARIDNARVAAALVGTQIVTVTVEGDKAEAATQLPIVEALGVLQAALETQPGVDATVSYLDYLAMLRRALDPDGATDPIENQQALDQLLLLLNPEQMRDVLSPDRARAQLLVYTHLSGSRAVDALTRRIERFAREHVPDTVRVRPTGTLVLLTRSADTLARQQVASLGQVFVVLAVLMIGLFRSVRLGLLSLVPNLFPVVVLFGIMGWVGIDLNISTSMIACIAIGIAVDDTIHYLTTFGRERLAHRDAERAVRRSAIAVGWPVVVTSITLSAGFLVVCLSNFEPVRHFGLLASATMAVALVADLLLLPALLLSTEGRRLI